MNNIKTTFSIKDLENLSGIKAHTIRIWEKRYNLLQPERTDTNIRLYDLENLQKLLNASFLNNNGLKISHIAKFTPEQIADKVRDFNVEKDINTHVLNSFKLSMVNFDSALFHKTYADLLEINGFENTFSNYIWPLLKEIGFLWQTDTITPAHEHFVTNLVRQKLTVEIDKVKLLYPENPQETYVLFLPVNEIHELGLMYLHYFLKKSRLHSIYLGQSVPVTDLLELPKHYNNITFISYFTIEPEADKIQDYLKEIYKIVLKGTNNQLWLAGRRLKDEANTEVPKGVVIFDSLLSIVSAIPQCEDLRSVAG